MLQDLEGKILVTSEEQPERYSGVSFPSEDQRTRPEPQRRSQAQATNTLRTLSTLLLPLRGAALKCMHISQHHFKLLILPMRCPACLLMPATHWMYVLVVDVDSFLFSSASRCSVSSEKMFPLHVKTRCPKAMMARLRTASLELVSWGSRHVRMEEWNE